MMRGLRWCASAWSVGVVLLSVVRSEGADEEASRSARSASIDSSEDSTEAEPSGNPQGGCPVLCNQDEACIENHCVEMCRPDCRIGAYCTPSGECEPLPEPTEPILTETERQRLAGLESADSRVIFVFDVAGIVGFGARVGFEGGRRDSVIARATLLNTGLMSHAVYVDNAQQRFDWGFGASVGYRHYEATYGNMRGFYLGGGLDYAVTNVAWRGPYAVAQLQHSAAPYGEFGYRWVFGKFAIGFGPTIALRYPIATAVVGQDQDVCGVEVECNETNSRRFEGMVHFDIGWFL